MDYKYFVCVTDEGRKLIANAIATETNIDFTHMSVGDANGTSYDPEPSMNALKHEVYKAEISSIKTNAEDNNILEFEFIVPASSGGYYIREAALYAAETVCAIARLPEQYKAQASEGAGSSMTVKLLIAVTSDAKVYINIPESLQYATQTYVGEAIKKHKEEEAPHSIYTEAIENLKNNKADKTHNHELTSLNGVLPVNKGGTGASNIIDARKALKTFRQNQLASGANLNDITYYDREMTIKHFNLSLINRPTHAVESGDYITSVQTEQNRGWQIFREIGRSERGSFGTYGRLYNNGVWDDWIILRNSDGTIPFEMGGTSNIYTTSQALWTEEVLSNGKILLTGFGYRNFKANETYKISIPKRLSSNNSVVAIGHYHGNVVGTVVGSKLDITISNKGVEQEINFIFKGVLA